MHLIYKNLVKNLVLLWTGNFKHLDEGTGSYELNPTVWEALGVATAASGSTIPSAFGAKPPNIAKDKTACTAKTWSFWVLYLGPVLLHNKFRRPIYYKHFIKIVELIRLCVEFELPRAKIPELRTDLAKWVEEYERLYYQHSPDCMLACPVTIHALLHLADSIKEAGSVWAYWAFPMERFCGLLQPTIKSRRHPYASMDSYVVARAQLSHIKLKFNLEDELLLQPPRTGSVRGSFADPAYSTCKLLPPRIISGTFPPESFEKILVALSTRYNKLVATVRRHLLMDSIEQWGKVRRLMGGDTMHASSLVQPREDSRDASFVRYDLLLDKHARNCQVEPEYDVQSYFGQLKNIFVIRLPVSRDLGIEKPTTLILAAVHSCTILAHNDLDMHYYKNLGRTEVVDMTSIQCVVGRSARKAERAPFALEAFGSSDNSLDDGMYALWIQR
ncbi:hypothetical protein B0H34DRAFT_784591 [Crassisporium funariophilum]|nr:hypothetical protein B0H34DRAFT_790781 [Crassisporium funariophilum]KAF8152510.1 hypothetical protein B0H34DRAFT_784591 [Crassisporium funariophilum]